MSFLGTSRGPVARAATLGLAVVLIACSSDRPSAPEVLGSLKIVSGGTQSGTSGAPLPDPIVITILGKSGEPVIGVPVKWNANDGGTIDPLISVTDSTGHAAAQWTLGTTGGVHMATASATGYPALTITALTPRISPLPSDDIRVLRLSTYDGSDQTVHPDYARLPATWPRPLRDYLAITPYPNANFALENPSLYESSDLVTWTPPDGMQNPIVRPANGYLSDPDIVFDPARNELYMYYREVVDDNAIYLTRSANAGAWTDPVVVARARNHDIVSPSVVRRADNEWSMYSVNSGFGCGAETASLELRRSSDGVRWSGPQRVSLSPADLYPWHVDVQWIPELDEYWALFNAKPAFSCTTTELYLATSKDGVHFNAYRNPVLSAGAIPEFADIVYRATFAYDRNNDAVTFWYSGARFDGSAFVWSSAVQQRNRLDVIEAASEQNGDRPTSLRSAPRAQLTDPP